MPPRTVLEIADLIQASLRGDGDRPIVGVAALADAGHDEMTFVVDDSYRERLRSSRAGAAIVPKDFDADGFELPLLHHGDPHRAFSVLVEAFAPEACRVPEGVHPTAVVEPGATLGRDVCIGPHVHVGAAARLADGVQLHCGVVVGEHSSIGEGSVLYPRVVLYPHVRVGAACVLHAGVVIGADGFGYDPSPSGWTKVFQGGTVVIEDDVEIGANSTVDRARVGVTLIGRGSKLDNLVHVGHNVRTGAACLFAGQVGVSGSVRMGERVILGGQSGVADHKTLGDGVLAAGRSSIFSDFAAGEKVGGQPAVPFADYARMLKRQKDLPEMHRRLSELERRLRDRSGPTDGSGENA